MSKKQKHTYHQNSKFELLKEIFWASRTYNNYNNSNKPFKEQTMNSRTKRQYTN